MCMYISELIEFLTHNQVKKHVSRNKRAYCVCTELFGGVMEGIFSKEWSIDHSLLGFLQLEGSKIIAKTGGWLGITKNVGKP